MEITLLFLINLLTGIFCLIPSSPQWQGRIQTCGMVFLLLLTWQIILEINLNGPLQEFGGLVYLDALSGLMLLLISLIGLLAALYSIGYMGSSIEESGQHPWKLKAYYGLFNLFILTMILMVSLNNLGLFWISIEASTFFSAFLVGYYNKKEPVEAAWKYIILCAVGMALAFIGITLCYFAAIHGGGLEERSLDWTYLMSRTHQLDPALLKVAFIFIFIGFGTKAGLAPLHNWLPDAHSEAPTPVSVLLSGVLIKCALYGIIRFGLITNAAIGSHFTNQFLLFFGLLSLGIAALFILIQRNIKRLLAYSSLEHIGIITVGLGFGSPLAVFGALFHLLNHALAKTLMFFTAGNLAKGYHSKRMANIKGAISLMPLSGVMLLIGGLALAGMPPFSVFLSEFYIVQGGVQDDFPVESIVFILLLMMIFGGLAYHFIKMAVGPSTQSSSDAMSLDETDHRFAPLALLIPFGLLLLLGFWQPPAFLTLLNNATKIITEGH